MNKRDAGDKILRKIKRRRYDRFMRRIEGFPAVVQEEAGKTERENGRYLAHIEKTKAKKPGQKNMAAPPPPVGEWPR
jgi:hypothetical protein